MSRDEVCGICGSERRSQEYVCRFCAGRLRGLLSDDLGELMTDVDDKIARRYRYQGEAPHVTGTPDYRLPVDTRAMDDAWTARQTLLIWVDVIARQRSHPIPQTWHNIGRYLHSQVDYLAQRADGPQIIDELTNALQLARRVIDRPPERVYAGTCDQCSEYLYAIKGRTIVECPKCGEGYTIQERQQALLTKAENTLLPATQASRALSTMGLHVDPTTIRKWAERERIQAIDHSGPRGSARYRLGDIVTAALTPTG